MVRLAAKNVEGETIANRVPFLPEEHPEEVVRHVEALHAKLANR